MSTRCAAKRPRGMSLVEVLLAAGLGLVVLLVILNLLIPAFRLSARGTAMIELDQRAALTDQRLERALRASTRLGVRAFSSGEGRFLSTHAIEGALTGSKPKLSPQLRVFVWQGKRLTEHLVDLPNTPARPTVLPDAELLTGLPGSRVSFTVEGVTLFETVVREGPQVDLRFVVEKGKEQLEIRRSIFLINSSG